MLTVHSAFQQQQDNLLSARAMQRDLHLSSLAASKSVQLQLSSHAR